jgi:hypothetical protein
VCHVLRDTLENLKEARLVLYWLKIRHFGMLNMTIFWGAFVIETGMPIRLVVVLSRLTIEQLARLGAPFRWSIWLPRQSILFFISLLYMYRSLRSGGNTMDTLKSESS